MIKNRLGLIGKTLTHSFSKKYFSQKFEKEHISDFEYDLYPLDTIQLFPQLVHSTEHLRGLNVTIPYKQQVIPFLSRVDPTAAAIGAVNTILIRDSELIGYNTDVYGFQHSLKRFLGQDLALKALILGTGGASKAVAFALQTMNIPFTYVSRNVQTGMLTYEQLDKETVDTHRLIINTTPLGTYPNVVDKPAIPYSLLSTTHYLYDLVYNPPLTAFMKAGQAQGAKVLNGQEMLELQAEKAWQIWTEKDLI